MSFQTIPIAVRIRLEESVNKRWIYTTSNGERIVLRGLFEKVTGHISKFKEIGDVVVQYDLAHAARPWALVRFFLQAALNDVETFGAMVEGVEITSRIIIQYTEVEKIYLQGESKLKTELGNWPCRTLCLL